MLCHLIFLVRIFACTNFRSPHPPMHKTKREMILHLTTFVFKDFFKNMDHFLNFYWICYCFYFMLFAFWPQDMWAHSSPTRDQTLTPALEGKVFTTGPPGKSLTPLLLTYSVIQGYKVKLPHFLNVFTKFSNMVLLFIYFLLILRILTSLLNCQI